MRFRKYVEVAVVKCSIFEGRAGEEGGPAARLERVRSTRGSEDEEDLM